MARRRHHTPRGPLEQAREAETQMGNRLNIDPLRPIIDDIALKLYELSPAQPEAAALCEGLADVLSDELTAYTQLLAAGEMAGAQRTLEAMGQKFLALALSISGPTASMSTQEPQDETTDRDRLFNDTAQTLSIEIERGLRLYEALESIHGKLDELRKKVIDISKTWSLGDDDPSIQKHLVWFSDETGIGAKASAFFTNPSSGQEVAMGELVEEASRRLAVVHAVIEEAEAARANAQGEAQEVLGLPVTAARLLKQLQKAQETIRVLPSDTVEEVVSSSELLTASELERWRGYEKHQLFGNPDRLRANLNQTAERIRRRLDDTPTLSEEAMSLLAEAQRYVERLRGRLGITAPVATAQPASRPLTPTQTSESKLAEATVNEERFEEIYQLVIAVASYKYCSPRHLVGLTVKSALGILVLLDKITEEEKAECRKLLADRLKSRSKTVEDNLQVRRLWEITNPQAHEWIYFRPKASGNLWVWRLVLRAQGPGQYIAKQLGLTKEAVETAFNDHRDNRQQWYDERRKEN